jgi:hypothetical protein
MELHFDLGVTQVDIQKQGTIQAMIRLGDADRIQGTL